MERKLKQNGANMKIFFLSTQKEYAILKVRKPCTPLVVSFGFNAHPARFFFCLNDVLTGRQK